MVGISKLLRGTIEPADALRYRHRAGPAGGYRPVVVWNATRRCNLLCDHCYAHADDQAGDDELTTAEAAGMIEDLAAMGCAVLLLSGGEPMLREDLPDLIAHATSLGLRTAASTNGTRLETITAERFAEAGLAYAGVSLDAASPEANDAFRGRAGAFADALAGMRAAAGAGIKVGLRFTMHAGNVEQIPAVFDLLAAEGIPRVCFYHLVAAGRAGNRPEGFLDASRTRQAVETIFAQTRRAHDAGQPLEVLTVDNHADGPLAVLDLEANDPARAEAARELLVANGGNASGQRIGCVSWDGQVYADQFWRTRPVGNIRQQPFSEIWNAPPADSLLSQLRNRLDHLQCRCLHCRFLPMCNGNLRARAEAAGNGPWGYDPGCYLTDEEIREPISD